MFRASFVLAALLVALDARAATFTVFNDNPSGIGSLAQAITSANATATADTITFSVLGSGPIVIPGPLPSIQQPLTIDGYSQAGTAVNNAINLETNAVLRVELDASSVAPFFPMLQINAGPTTIKGLVIRGMPQDVTGLAIGEKVSGVKIEGNFIGTTVDGMSDDSEGVGIRVFSDSATIGGATVAARNLISGNGQVGLDIRGPLTVVTNNLIGLDADGEPVLGNGTGIHLIGPVQNTIVGGAGALSPNAIADNEGNGIEMAPQASGNAKLLANRIYDNGGLAIDLNADGVTLNDTGDTDTGPNGLQNFPELSFAVVNGIDIHVEGSLDGPAGTYRIEFFRNAEPDETGFGEAPSFLGSIPVVKGASRHFFRAELPLPPFFAHPVYVTATATNEDEHETSELSAAIELLPGGTELVVVNTNDSGAGSLRAAIVTANTDAVVNTIVFQIPETNPVIKPLTSYVITQPVIIDGYTQPLATPNTLPLGSNAVLRVQIDGSLLPPSSPDFQISSSGTLIRGLVIQWATADGIRYTSAASGQVEGSFIGTDRTGSFSFANAMNGIDTGPASNLTIGGAMPAQRNVISGNGNNGILLGGNDTVVQGNVIGANAGNFGPNGNGDNGIFVYGNDLMIGADGPGNPAANIISDNDDSGITVGIDAQGVTILGNHIRDNGDLGINLSEGVGPMVTPNDIDDVDPALQNFPILSYVYITSPGQIRIHGSLDVGANPESLYSIRIFANDACDPSGYGEGELPLSVTEVDLAPDDETFSFVIQANTGNGDFVTATATGNDSGNTSEFSPCVEVGAAPVLCGDAAHDEMVTASDALQVLRTAVGARTCELCICDVNNSGTVTTPDALQVLRKAVGQAVVLGCPGCVGS